MLSSAARDRCRQGSGSLRLRHACSWPPPAPQKMATLCLCWASWTALCACCGRLPTAGSSHMLPSLIQVKSSDENSWLQKVIAQRNSGHMLLWHQCSRFVAWPLGPEKLAQQLPLKREKVCLCCMCSAEKLAQQPPLKRDKVHLCCICSAQESMHDLLVLRSWCSSCQTPVNKLSLIHEICIAPPSPPTLSS